MIVPSRTKVIYGKASQFTSNSNQSWWKDSSRQISLFRFIPLNFNICELLTSSHNSVNYAVQAFKLYFNAKKISTKYQPEISKILFINYTGDSLFIHVTLVISAVTSLNLSLIQQVDYLSL